jgi:hypothetical protein
VVSFASELCDAQWDMITAVAAHLVEAGELSHDAIAALGGSRSRLKSPFAVA